MYTERSIKDFAALGTYFLDAPLLEIFVITFFFACKLRPGAFVPILP